MKKLLAILLLSCPVLMAETYYLVHANYSYSTYGGMTTLKVELHNNGLKNAACTVEANNQSQMVAVAPGMSAEVRFRNVYNSQKPRFGCEAQ